LALDSSDNALAGRELSLAYGRSVVVDGIDVGLERGRVTTIVGPNGCGKSTTLAALARLLRPRTGAVLLDGRMISSMSTRDVARRLALLPQGVRAPGELRVRELVGYGRYPHQSLLARPSSEDREAVEWALDAAGLTDLADRPVDALSGGERQRAWVGMALAQRTDILLLDEPTTYLDVRHQVELLSLVRRLNRDRGMTVGMVLHDLNQAHAFSDRIVLMKAGHVITSGAPAAVLTLARLRDVFDVDIRIVPATDGGPPAFVPAYRDPSSVQPTVMEIAS
jgi:ABC-type cobalamin/Fe3+-siderophores transport system ATPase subunit